MKPTIMREPDLIQRQWPAGDQPMALGYSPWGPMPSPTPRYSQCC
jgi:hypothetical protein